MFTLAIACTQGRGARNRVNGYRCIKVDRRKVGEHRAAWEAINGPIPAGLTIDHLCHSLSNDCPGGPCAHRGCVEPTHLEVVSHRTNILRSNNVCARNARKTHCKRGHAFTPENTCVATAGHRAGHRSCKTCRRAADACRAARKAVRS